MSESIGMTLSRCIFSLLGGLALVACTKTNLSKSKPVATPPISSIDYQVDMDSAVADIYEWPPPGGVLPLQIKWSPDSSSVAFLRKIRCQDGKYANELWIHEMAKHIERPLVSGCDLPVVEYDWCGPKRIVSLENGDLYDVSLDGKTRRITETEDSEEGAKCSLDGAKVAFIRKHNIFAIDLKTYVEQRITSGGTEQKTMGEVAWVYEEEFRTDKGFEWSPTGNRLWFFEMDLSNVPVRNVMRGALGETRKQFYPSPGEPNPKVRIGVAQIGSTASEVTWLNFGDDADIYLPRAMWTSDGKEILAVRLDRLQTILELLKCDFKSGSCETIIEERDPHWINLPSDPKIIRNGKELLWILERDGFPHIYRYDLNGRFLRQITKGKWSVTSIDGVDEKEGIVYFRANRDRPTDFNIYKVSVRDGKIEPLNEIPGCHGVDFSPNVERYIDTHSAVNRSPRADIFNRAGSAEATLFAQDLKEYKYPNVVTDFIPIKTFDGETLNASLIRPIAFNMDQKYPVLVYVYGGPNSQIVRNEFRPRYLPWMYLMASRGVLVFSVDGRGSFGRGHEFEIAIHRRLGEIELKDQLAGVEYLKTLPFVNPDRIGIFGWSFGGTMALLAMFRTKGVFKAGVSVAPVTDWRQYDTAYTERYMQRPSDNPEGYKDTSLLSYASGLKRPLLLIHGLSDDNVHFRNSTLLIEELITNGKHFEFMVYPGKNHSLDGDYRTLKHVFSTITEFLRRYL